MKKSLAQLKRDAKSGNYFGEMFVRNGSTYIPELLSGVRRLVDANSNSIFFENNEGKKSALELPCSSLVLYTDNELKIFKPRLRDLNEGEKNILAKWDAMRDRKQEKIDAMSETYTSYYSEMRFLSSAGYGYLAGTIKEKGLKLDLSTRKVYDDSIKGELDMMYIITSR